MSSDEALLKVENLVKHFPVNRGLFRKTVGQVRAVSGVSFEIHPGETLGLVGESGCGKTTVGRCLLRLLQPTSGDVWFDGKNLSRLTESELRPLRQEIQLIFQDPFSSLNPRMRIVDIVGEALVSHGLATQANVEHKVAELLGKVGIPPNWLHRYPHEFSGGQRQRIGIARALALRPKLIVCDEAVSALDVSIQAQVLNLLMDLKEEFGLSYLFIAHDLSVVRHISDRVGVMYLGEIVELADRDSLFESPAHPYTQALLSAIPVPDPAQKKQRVVLKGDVPSPLNPPSGCRFHTRCPAAVSKCASEEPPLVSLKTKAASRLVRCVHAENLPEVDWHVALQQRIDEAIQEKREERTSEPPLRALRSRSRVTVEASTPLAACFSELPGSSRVGLSLGALSCVALIAAGHTGVATLILLALLIVSRLFLAQRVRDYAWATLVIVSLGLFASWPVGKLQKQSETKARIAALEEQIRQYSQTYGSPPVALSELGWRLFEVFPGGVPEDSWGNRIVFTLDEETGKYSLTSPGPDGVTSEDDLSRRD